MQILKSAICLGMLTLLLPGCGLNPEYMDKQVRTASDARLPRGYFLTSPAFPAKNLAWNEMVRRGLMRNSLRPMIDSQRVVLGMNRHEAMAAWGPPKDVNRTIATYTYSEQWVYSGPAYSSKFLYFNRQGMVEAIQD